MPSSLSPSVYAQRTGVEACAPGAIAPAPSRLHSLVLLACPITRGAGSSNEEP